MKDFIKTVKIVLLATVVTLGVNYVYAWTGPTDTPPDGNVKAPINVGTVSQTKQGTLGVGGALGVSGLLHGYSNGSFDGKVTSASTLGTDSGNTLVTKDYLDSVSAASTQVRGGHYGSCAQQRSGTTITWAGIGNTRGAFAWPITSCPEGQQFISGSWKPARPTCDTGFVLAGTGNTQMDTSDNYQIDSYLYWKHAVCVKT